MISFFPFIRRFVEFLGCAELTSLCVCELLTNSSFLDVKTLLFQHFLYFVGIRYHFRILDKFLFFIDEFLISYNFFFLFYLFIVDRKHAWLMRSLFYWVTVHFSRMFWRLSHTQISRNVDIGSLSLIPFSFSHSSNLSASPNKTLQCNILNLQSIFTTSSMLKWSGLKKFSFTTRNA